MTIARCEPPEEWRNTATGETKWRDVEVVG
jgi:hypothetical protein